MAKGPWDYDQDVFHTGKKDEIFLSKDFFFIPKSEKS